MITSNLIVELLVFFARFVPVSTRLQCFKQTQVLQEPQYAQIKEDIIGLDELKSFQELDTYVLSINDKHISDRMRNSKNYILFVEYGNINSSNNVGYNNVSLSITVAGRIDVNNTDMLQEAIRMQVAAEILTKIIDCLKKSQCIHLWQITGDTSITPLDPALFFGCGGWSATFILKKPIL